MGLVYKKLEKIGRSMYLYFPEQERRTAFKRCSITILRDGEDEASVRYFLDELGMQKLAEEQEIILSFPNPENGRWNYDFSGETDDLTAFHDFQDAMTKEDDKPLATRPNGIPTYEAMLSVWHPMNDTRYLVGTGSGAHMVCTLAACVAENIAAIFAVGGRLCEEARYQAVNAAVPAFLVDSDRKTQNYFNVVNETEWKETADQITVTRNKRNPSQCVMNSENMQLSKELVNRVWEELFSVTRRTNTSVYGDVEPKPDMKKAGFELYLDDDRLEEKVKVKHTWFVHVPSGVKDGTSGRVPLMLFFHGGSDNPEEAAQMSRFHELGEKEGFITVYPWGTDRTQWNSFLAPDGADDIGYTVALIQYMKEHYPVDPERVYLSGFSNGAGQAQAVAMLHPELIAAICHIESEMVPVNLQNRISICLVLRWRKRKNTITGCRYGIPMVPGKFLIRFIIIAPNSISMISGRRIIIFGSKRHRIFPNLIRVDAVCRGRFSRESGLLPDIRNITMTFRGFTRMKSIQ